jgi:uncharacterized membrane protein (DUF485 family)
MEQEQEQVQQIQQQEVKQKISRLRILFRIAFICNVFFVVCMILLFSHADKYFPQPLIEFSIILGWLAPVINLISFILVVILISRIRKKQIPLWLLYTNLICFIFQIYFFFILHDQLYT